LWNYKPAYLEIAAQQESIIRKTSNPKDFEAGLYVFKEAHLWPCVQVLTDFQGERLLGVLLVEDMTI